MRLQESINTFNQEVALKNNIVEWFKAPIKSITSKNISIAEWNELVIFLKNTVSDAEAIRKFVDSLSANLQTGELGNTVESVLERATDNPNFKQCALKLRNGSELTFNVPSTDFVTNVDSFLKAFGVENSIYMTQSDVDNIFNNKYNATSTKIVGNEAIVQFYNNLDDYVADRIISNIILNVSPDGESNSAVLNVSMSNVKGDTLSASVPLPPEKYVSRGELLSGNILRLHFQENEHLDIPLANIVSGLVSTTAFNNEIVRIDNLIAEHMDTGSFEKINTVAAVVNIPNNSTDYATISKIGGMTHRDGNTLKNAKGTAVKSVGRNLLNFEKWSASIRAEGGTKTVTGSTITLTATNGDCYTQFNDWSDDIKIPVKKGEKIIFSWKTNRTDATGNVFIFGNGETSSMVSVNSNNTVVAYDVPDGVTFITYRIGVGGVGVPLTYYDMQIEKGESNTEYSPYTEHTLAIPQAVQSLEGYGCGINSSLYNYIDFENKKFNRVVCVVDLGTYDWAYITGNSNGAFFQAALGKKSVENAKCLCSKYESSSAWYIFNSSIDKVIGVESEYIAIRDTSYTDATAFKNAMSGVMLVYELATPTTEDIPEISNLIGVEGGGTLTFENEYGYDVPSEIVIYTSGKPIIVSKQFVGNLLGNATRANSLVTSDGVSKTYEDILNDIQTLYTNYEEVLF